MVVGRQGMKQTSTALTLKRLGQSTELCLGHWLVENRILSELGVSPTRGHLALSRDSLVI